MVFYAVLGYTFTAPTFSAQTLMPLDVASMNVVLVDGGFFVCQTGTPELFEREVG
jgi:hypothetical protein